MPDSKVLRRLLDPEVMKNMDTSKALEMLGGDTSWIGQRRLDVSDLNRFIINRLQPCHPLFELAGRNGKPLPDPDYPLLYHTNRWPGGAPPAGYVREAVKFDWNDLLTSHINMWQLQLDRTRGGLAITTQWTANKLVRAALWIVKTQGFLAAVDYLFSLMDHGFVIMTDAMVSALVWLLWARRRVVGDAELPAYFLRDANFDMMNWRTADLKFSVPAPFVRELSDDIELAIEKVEERERLAREAPDGDGWLVAYARLGLAARVTRQTMELMGLADQFGYKIYSVRFGEFSADVGAFFYSLRGERAANCPGNALRLSWGMATSFAMTAKQEGEEWLRHMLEERVVLPDALTVDFLKTPFVYSDKPEWQRPSPRLSRVLAQLAWREIPIERHYAGNGNSTTTEMVAEAFREAGHSDLADLAGWASTIWPLFHREATASPPPHDSDVEILSNFLLYLLVQMPTDREEAKAWLDREHLSRSDADLEHCYQEPVEPGSRSDHEERLRKTERYVTRYPYNGTVRAHLALRQYECGEIEEARRSVEEALMLDPGKEYIWACASMVFHGKSDDDYIATNMTKYLELLNTAR
jgi:hypothetical protein